MNNFAISLKKDALFDKGAVYNITEINDGMAGILYDGKNKAPIDICNKDFIIILNPTEEMFKYIARYIEAYRFRN
jgi:hypothetical protein